jgi:CO/xanthine dehydrogenase Mo-binding subunit
MGDTDRTADGGKTSASRQTFVSGNAVKAAGEDLRQKLLRLANVGAGATITIGDGQVVLSENGHAQGVDLARLPILNDEGDVLLGEGRFDPPTTALDANGQGIPYATYGFAAQMAEVEVDVELGTVKVRRIVAAHDVGRASIRSRSRETWHRQPGLADGSPRRPSDYLIPTVGDMPESRSSSSDRLGPWRQRASAAG